MPPEGCGQVGQRPKHVISEATIKSHTWQSWKAEGYGKRESRQRNKEEEKWSG